MAPKKKIKIKQEEGKLYIDGIRLTDFQVGELRKFTFSHLFNGAHEDEFLIYNKKDGMFTVRSQPVGIPKLRVIKEHAKFLESSEVFRLILNEMKAIAEKKMFDESKTVEDLLAGKMMLYNIDVLKKKIRNLAQLSLPKADVE